MSWTIERIVAICDAEGNPPIRTDTYRTADASPPAEQIIKLTFASGRTRSFCSLRGAPWEPMEDTPIFDGDRFTGVTVSKALDIDRWSWNDGGGLQLGDAYRDDL